MIFWTIFVIMVLLWYAILTVIVGYRGGKDIRNMIDHLEQQHDEKQV